MIQPGVRWNGQEREMTRTRNGSEQAFRKFRLVSDTPDSGS